MRRRPEIMRLAALLVIVCLPLVGVSATASAKAPKAPKGCHKTHTCTGTTGQGSGSGGTTPPTVTVTVDPNPLVETGASTVDGVIQVETEPSFAGDLVNIDSSQLAASCGGTITFGSLQLGATTTPDSIEVVLDDDGNVTVSVSGTNCAPGPSTIEADLPVAPYYSAITTLSALPPNVTAPGVTGDPADEVETNDAGGAGAAYNSTPPGPGTTTG